MVLTLPYFFSVFHEIGDIDQELAVEMRAAGAVEPEQIVARSSRRLGGRACGNVLHRDVVDRDRDLVLLAPVLGELVEPCVVFRNEVAPLHDRQRLGVGHGARHEWRRDQRARRRRQGEARSFKKRRLVIREILLVPIFGSSSVWCQLDEADPDGRIASPTGSSF